MHLKSDGQLYGEFISDPDGDVFEIKLIDPKDYKQLIEVNKADLPEDIEVREKNESGIIMNESQ